MLSAAAAARARFTKLGIMCAHATCVHWPVSQGSSQSVPFNLPEMCEKHCVKVATANPDANAVAKSTDDTLAPTPAPAAAPHTMNTYRNEARHSDIIDLKGERKGREDRVESRPTQTHAEVIIGIRVMTPNYGMCYIRHLQQCAINLPPELDRPDLGLHARSHRPQAAAHHL